LTDDVVVVPETRVDAFLGFKAVRGGLTRVHFMMVRDVVDILVLETRAAKINLFIQLFSASILS
jgi:hypothetical protein